jgi:hypothetical protein
MSCDKLVYDLAQEVDGSPNVFIRKDWLNILDNQNGSYQGNQSVIDTSQLTNSNKYMSYREAYLSIPMLLTLVSTTAATTFAPAAAATSSDYSLGLKNWFGSVIHSFTLDYNGTTVIQQTPYINMWNSFRLMTTFSWSDIQLMGPTIGFYPDNPLTWTNSAAASIYGIGIANNTTSRSATVISGITAISTTHNQYGAGNGNDGLVMRQSYINFDVDGFAGAAAGVAGTASAAYSTAITSANVQNLWKSYVSKKTTGVATTQVGIFQISVVATVFLRHIHSFFSMCPLIKGAYMKMTLTLNNCSSSFSAAGGATGVLTLSSVSNAVGGINPLMIAAAGTGNGNAGLGALSYIANLSVGAVCLDNSIQALVGFSNSQGTLSRNIFLYVPSYVFNPVFEQAYLSNAVKRINYTDVYQYQINNVAANANINNLLTNGLANIKSVLLLPFHSSTSAANRLPTGTACWLSPFDPAGAGPTSPLCFLNNFNVVISGQNTIYNTQKYNFEQFNNQLYGANSVNGGMTDGLTSGLINQQGFEMEYCYYYVDVSRMLPVEETVPKSVQIIGQNASALAIDLMCFIEYGVSVSIDALTGARV